MLVILIGSINNSTDQRGEIKKRVGGSPFFLLLFVLSLSLDPPPLPIAAKRQRAIRGEVESPLSGAPIR